MSDERQNLVAKSSEKVRYLSVIIAGCFLILASSIGGISFMYYLEIKALFHLSQKEVGILVTIYMSGIYFVLPYAVIHRRFGFYASYFAASLLTCMGFLQLALAAHMPDSVPGLPFLIYIFMFTLCNGRSGIMFLVRLVAMTTTPAAHTGKAVTGVGNMVFLGEMTFSLIYSAKFADVQKTAQFFLISFAIVLTALVIYIIVYSLTGRTKELTADKAHCKTTDNQESNFNHDETSDKHEGTESAHDAEIIGIKEMLCSLKFHLYVWSGTLILSPNMMFFTNIRLLLQSLRLQQYERSLITTMMCTVIISQLYFGTMYDAIKIVGNKVCLMILVAIFNALSFGILLLSINNIVVVFISVVLMSCTLGGAMVTFVTFSSKIFGTSNIGMVQGILMTCYAIFSLIFNYTSGAIYDHFVPSSAPVESNVCFGADCYWWSFLMLLCVSVVSSILPMCLFCHYRNKSTFGK